MSTPYLIPISVKGIVFEDKQIWLRRNERSEWELPGGKLDLGEQPEQTVVRELREELGFEVRVAQLVRAHVYTRHALGDEAQGVLVLMYLCELVKRVGQFELKGEAGEAAFARFPLAELPALPLPDFYQTAIQQARQLKLSSTSGLPNETS